MFMNIRDLAYVRAVARLKHFGRAAAACNVSQPALSSQIKKLERELGVVLFERDNRSVRLTAIGEEIVGLAGDAINVIDKIRSRAATAQDPLIGDFTLGFIPTIAPYLVPHFVRQNREALPGLNLGFREDITERLEQSLLGGDLDAAILATPPVSSKLDVIALYDEPFWVIYPEGHALRMIDTIRTQDLPPDELLLLSEGHCFRDQAMDVCQLGALPEIQKIRATSLETLINMVAADQGISLVPAMALSGGWIKNFGVQTQKLDDPEAYRRIYLTFRKTLPRRVLLETMADVICANLPEGVRELREFVDHIGSESET